MFTRLQKHYNYYTMKVMSKFKIFGSNCFQKYIRNGAQMETEQSYIKTVYQTVYYESTILYAEYIMISVIYIDKTLLC